MATTRITPSGVPLSLWPGTGLLLSAVVLLLAAGDLVFPGSADPDFRGAFLVLLFFVVRVFAPFFDELLRLDGMLTPAQRWSRRLAALGMANRIAAVRPRDRKKEPQFAEDAATDVAERLSISTEVILGVKNQKCRWVRTLKFS